MKPHYFDDPAADPDDALLGLMVKQGYVPPTCLLNGRSVFALTTQGDDPCAGCDGPRARCHGRPKLDPERPRLFST
jgi:hypothetical protein